MKTFIYILGLCLIPLTSMSQEEKPVLVSELQGEYRGLLENELASGYGSAKGENIYIGEFKKGYPHGKGKYIWAGDDYYEGSFKKGKRHGYGKQFLILNGRSSYIEGIWKGDKYIGKSNHEKGYKVTRKFGGIDRISYIYKGKGGMDEVSIRLMRSGASKKPLNRSFYASSGDVLEINFPYKYSIQNIDFPFNGQMLFYVQSKTSQALIKCELDFELIRKGSWDIIIYV